MTDHTDDTARSRHPAYRLTRHESPESYRADLHDLGFDDVFIERAELFDHLLSEHGVTLTVGEWQEATVADLRAMDPCEVKP